MHLYIVVQSPFWLPEPGFGMRSLKKHMLPGFGLLTANDLHASPSWSHSRWHVLI